MSNSIPNRTRRTGAGLLLVFTAALGCCGKHIPCPSYEHLGQTWQNGSQPTPDTYPDPNQTLAASLDATFGHNPHPTPPTPLTETRPLNVLSVSGGGKYAAYAAGLLQGWTESGARPQFDVVTGISSGALIAVYAFLGPKYDERMVRSFVEVRRRDLFRFRPFLGPFTIGAFASSKPLERRIEQEFGDEAMADLQRAHMEGRRLFVATSNLITLRPAIWDLGAIAVSGRPDAAVLIRKVLLAATSIPGWVQPIEFDVTVNGRHYRELHGDCGNQIQAFVRTANGLPPNSNVYVLTAGKLYHDPMPGRPRVLATVTAAASNSLYALFRADVMKLYALCAVTRSRFHLIALPPSVTVQSASMSFDRDDLQKLYATGYQMSVHGIPWRTTPPGTQPGETLTPRTGLDFTTPESGPQ